MFGFIHWNPPREAFFLPGIHWPIYWYSLWFALGFYGAIVIARKLLLAHVQRVAPQEWDKKTIASYIETFSLYAFVGMVVGARLGHVLFYDLSYYLSNPVEILKVWHGGLSSHGGVIGLLIALWLFSRRQQPASYLPRGKNLLDLLAIASAWTAGCIRIGNFFNQEIVGSICFLPWAIVFGSPQEAAAGVPRHPAQLYEALVAFLLLVCMLIVSRHGRFARNGKIAGWYLLITFVARFGIEFIKVEQCAFDSLYIHMGQLLSIPVILLAIYLITARGGKQEEQGTGQE